MVALHANCVDTERQVWVRPDSAWHRTISDWTRSDRTRSDRTRSDRRSARPRHRIFRSRPSDRPVQHLPAMQGAHARRPRPARRRLSRDRIWAHRTEWPRPTLPFRVRPHFCRRPLPQCGQLCSCSVRDSISARASVFLRTSLIFVLASSICAGFRSVDQSANAAGRPLQYQRSYWSGARR